MKTIWQEQTAVEQLRENAIRCENGLQVALLEQTAADATECGGAGVQIRETD